jgi:hypothetical protein
MIYALEERIGDPTLFCGRKQQMDLLVDWGNMIPKKKDLNPNHFNYKDCI